MIDRLSRMERRQFPYPMHLPQTRKIAPLLFLLLRAEMDVRLRDNGGRRSGMDRRQSSYYSIYLPERRSGKDRRSGEDRRKQWLGSQQAAPL